jgi:hypothetical protein
VPALEVYEANQATMGTLEQHPSFAWLIEEMEDETADEGKGTRCHSPLHFPTDPRVVVLLIP